MPTTTKKEPICYGQVRTRNSIQEWYETASSDARKRATLLRKHGLQVICSSMGMQTTPMGKVKMTLLTILTKDTNLPYVKIISNNWN